MRIKEPLLALVCACVVLVIGTVAAVNLAVPQLAASALHPSASALLWIVDTYVIVFACLVIPGGAAGDRFGHKRVLVTGLLLFAAGALVSAAAPGMALLLAGRAVTGVGAAAVLPNTLAVLLHAMPAGRRTAAIATWAAMTGAGGVLGNVGGGALLAGASWRWLFAASALLGVGLAALVARVAPTSARSERRLDPVGTALLVAASFALLIGIIEGPEQGWTSPLVLGGFAGAGLLFTVWTLVELRVEHPLFDPRLLRIPALRAAGAGMTTLFFGMFALFYVNASFLQYGKGFSVLETGLGIVPMTLPILVLARHVGPLVERFGLRPTLTAAFTMAGGGLLGLSTSTASTPYPAYAAWLVVVGCGVALALPALSGVIAHALPPAQAGVAAGFQSTTREFGSALGVAVIGTVIAGTHRTGDLASTFVSGAGTGLRVVGLAVLVLGLLVVLSGSRDRAASPEFARR